MVMRLSNNLNSHVVQNRLNRSNLSVSQISERLASGSRINRASDDAAGLAISLSLQAQTRIAGQSIRNLNEGISALNIAEGAIESLSGILTRIEEISAQAMNGTFSSTQRTTMQSEVTELQNEWNRIVSSTNFNGKQLLTGDQTCMVLNGGMGTQGTVGVQIGKEALAGGVNNAAGGTTRVSTSSAGAETGGALVDSISGDGRYVVMRASAANLVAGDSNGVLDVFLKDRQTGVMTRLSTDSAGNQATGGNSFNGLISSNGNYVAFSSSATNLVSGDTNGLADIFLKNVTTGETIRVSTDSSGSQANAGAALNAISADGRYVVFESGATNLASGDSNGTVAVFVKDTST